MKIITFLNKLKNIHDPVETRWHKKKGTVQQSRIAVYLQLPVEELLYKGFIVFLLQFTNYIFCVI